MQVCCYQYTPVKPCKRNRIIDWTVALPTKYTWLSFSLSKNTFSLRSPHCIVTPPPPPDIGGALCKHL